MRYRDLDWQFDPADGAYTLISDVARCRVWRTQGNWQAIVSYHDDSTAAYNFSTAEDAKVWCEAHVKEAG